MDCTEQDRTVDMMRFVCHMELEVGQVLMDSLSFQMQFHIDLVDYCHWKVDGTDVEEDQ